MVDREDSNLYKKLKEDFSKSANHPQYQLWLNYAMSTNERGKLVVETIKNFIPSLQNKRHLDIGCGYGGTCIAFASEQAESVGIDYDDRLLNFSRENAKDHPHLSLEFYKTDVMNCREVKSLGKFDVITCDNVIEHVADPSRLIAFCRHLLNPSGLIYLTAPNAFSIGQIRKDCHYGLPGVSLLDPDDGGIFVNQVLGSSHYDVSWYFHYGTFEHLFRRYGFSMKLLNPYQVSSEDVVSLYQEYNQFLADVTQQLNGISLSDDMRQRVVYRLKHHIQMLETDLLFEQELHDPYIRSVYRNGILRDFHTELWYFVLQFQDEAMLSQESKPHSPLNLTVDNTSGRELVKILWMKLMKRVFGKS